MGLAKYPSEVWDGDSKSRNSDNAPFSTPTAEDWSQVVAEVAATQTELDTAKANITSNDSDISVLQNNVILTGLTNKNSGALVIGTPVYLSGSGQVKSAMANAAGTSFVIGLSKLETVASNAATVEVQLQGLLTATSAQWDAVTGGSGGLTDGARYFLSNTNAGRLTSTAPTTSGSFVVPIGWALGTTSLVFFGGQSISENT
jgi:hypothetical protein